MNPNAPEPHRTARIGWLRAAVLGANDGIISTSSLMVGVAAASDRRGTIIAGIAGLVAGALSMAAGEYVSVSSQADTERAELERERNELAADPAFELQELTDIYVGRGLSRDLAGKVASELMARDALGAHARDELGLTDVLSARPVQAAGASALSFAIGALLPLGAALLVPQSAAGAIVLASLVALFALGALAARIGGAPVMTAAVRVTFWGALAMGLTAAAGWLFGAAA